MSDYESVPCTCDDCLIANCECTDDGNCEDCICENC